MNPDRASAIRALRRAAAGSVKAGRRVALLARPRRPADGAVPSRGLAFAGTVWLGGDTEPTPGVLVVDGAGRMVEFRPTPAVLGLAAGGDSPAGGGQPAGLGRPTGGRQGRSAAQSGLPADLPVLGGPGHWVVPGLVDAHVHLGFDPTAIPDPYGRFTVSGERTGLVGVRDLGAPMAWATQWRTGHRPARPGSPFVAVTGPILTAAGGYPSRSWGADGYAEFVSSPAQARWVVQRLAAAGIDLIKVALEPGSQGWPVPQPRVVRAIVEAAHGAGLPVVAHAMSAELVLRALDAGVDELAHTPNQRLAPEVIDRIASSGVSVTSTLQTCFSAGTGRDAAANAADLVAAGVRLRYGTDLGNAGTRPGVDPRELDRLAAAGLGRLGALRAATEWAATAPGMRRRTGRLVAGEQAALVLLPSSPLVEPGVWRTPSAIFVDGRLTVVEPADLPASTEQQANTGQANTGQASTGQANTGQASTGQAGTGQQRSAP